MLDTYKVSLLHAERQGEQTMKQDRLVWCLFMVRRLEKRFKNILTMNIVFWRAVIAGDNATYGDKMRFSVTF